MKRLVLAVATLALIAVGCGESSGDDTTSNSEPAATAAPTTAAPATTSPPPPTTTAPPAIVPGADADVDAIVEAFTIAFDSTSDYDAKAPYLVDPTGLEETVASYLTTGTSFGGIGVIVTAVVVNGDQADVTYDLAFNDNPAYPDQSGAAIRTDAGWQVPRDVFCGLMKSARVGCPAE
jgi:hypothetical protein